MNNRGQTTVLFSLIISVLLIFTFTALEVGRVYLGRVRAAAVIHSAKVSIMADYNRELFERYHLLFLDPTYGTKSEAMLEEKMADYLESSLCEDSTNIYTYSLEELALIQEENVLSHNMKRLKEQIEEYEKTAGIVQRSKEVIEKMNAQSTDISGAQKETNDNAVMLPIDTQTTGESTNRKKKKAKKKKKEEDPRDTLKKALQFGVLSFLLPENHNIKSEIYDLQDAPSANYKSEDEPDKQNDFQDIGVLKSVLSACEADKDKTSLSQRAALLDYVDYHFSNGVNPKPEHEMQCEIEYILKGKNNDYDNMEAVVNEIIWLRMPINYAYLLTDESKKAQALTVSATICTATGAGGLIEVVKYLLLGCWAYGETLCEMRSLLAGEAIPYVKTKENWVTDLMGLDQKVSAASSQNGMEYRDYLLLLLAKKGNKKLDGCYARMLDVMEFNLKKEDPQFAFKNYVYEITIQGKLRVNSLFSTMGDDDVYQYFFEEQIKY